MAFTYADSLSSDRDKVRFHLQDTTLSSGPKPSGGNFSDAEIDGLVTAYGSWQKAVAGAFEVLASAWAQYADLQVGPRRESMSQIAARYAAQAKEWATRYGVSTSGVGHRVMTRVDGYSQDVDADDV